MEKKKQSLARLLKNGYLRISASLLPDDMRETGAKFVVGFDSAHKTLTLRISKNGSDDHLAKRKALFSNENARSPLVSVKEALKFMGMKLPTKSMDVPVKRKGALLVIQF